MAKKTGDAKKKQAEKNTFPVKKPQAEKILLENFVSLQKVMTNLSLKLDNLANQMSSLLELFEISAKTLAEKEVGTKKEGRDNQKIMERMDSLLEQNRTIARGVALMHEKDYGEQTQSATMQQPLRSNQPNLQRPVSQEMQNIRFRQLPRN